VYDIGIFEQPLNERFRLMLRIEQLFARMDHHLAGEDPWDTHAALQALMELLQMVARGDSKRELIQELDRQRAALGRQRAHDEQSEHDQLLEALHSGTGALGEELRGNTLLGQLQQRSTAGGRPGMLELPSYQEWLQRPAADRHADVRVWLQPMVPARRAIDRALSMVRESGQWQTITFDLEQEQERIRLTPSQPCERPMLAEEDSQDPRCLSMAVKEIRVR